MEAILASIKNQKAIVDAKVLQWRQAKQAMKDASAELKREAKILREYETRPALLNIANQLHDDTKIIHVGRDIPLKTFTIANNDGQAVKFAVKRIAYPLELKDGVLVGLQPPRPGAYIQTYSTRTKRTRLDTITSLQTCKILETDVYYFLNKYTIMHYDGKEHMFPFSTLRDWCGCAALTYIGSNKIEFEALLLYTKTAIHRSGIYREIDLPAATTGGYLFVRIACRV